MHNHDLKQNKIVSIADLHPHPSNYRSHPPEQINDLVASLQRFGATRSIVVQDGPDGYLIVAGHGLVEAAKKLQYTELRADIIPADWSAEQVRGYLVADNNLSNKASDDETILAELLQEQADAGYDLASLGTDDEALRQMLEALGDEYLGSGEQDEEEDETPEVEEEQTRVRLGDVWQLGRHRLLVGDSTKQEDVKRLMQSDRASLIVTSPPYWVGREYEQEHGKEEIIAHIEASAKVMASVMDAPSHIAINTGTTTETKQGGDVRRVWLLLDWWAAAFSRYGWNMRNVRIWAKHGGFTTFTAQQDVIDQNWEFLASFTPDKPKHQNQIGERWALDGVWDCQPQTANVGHSAPFPVEIPERYILLYTEDDDIIFEPYCGSGTTLIACERNNRKCRGMELSPKYADVILRRFTAESGIEPELIERLEVANVP